MLADLTLKGDTAIHFKLPELTPLYSSKLCATWEALGRQSEAGFCGAGKVVKRDL